MNVSVTSCHSFTFVRLRIVKRWTLRKCKCLASVEPLLDTHSSQALSRTASLKHVLSIGLPLAQTMDACRAASSSRVLRSSLVAGAASFLSVLSVAVSSHVRLGNGVYGYGPGSR